MYPRFPALKTQPAKLHAISPGGSHDHSQKNIPLSRALPNPMLSQPVAAPFLFDSLPHSLHRRHRRHRRLYALPHTRLPAALARRHRGLCLCAPAAHADGTHAGIPHRALPHHTCLQHAPLLPRPLPSATFGQLRPEPPAMPRTLHGSSTLLLPTTTLLGIRTAHPRAPECRYGIGDSPDISRRSPAIPQGHPDAAAFRSSRRPPLPPLRHSLLVFPQLR